MSANATEEIATTNSTLSSSKNGSKADAKVVGLLVAVVGLVLILIAGIATIQYFRKFRSKRRKVYHVSDKVLKKGIIAKKLTMSHTAIQNDFAEDEPVQALRYQQSTEHLIAVSEVDYTTFTTRPSITQNDDATELPTATQPTDEKESSQCMASSNSQAVDKQETSEESFIPRANPLLLQLKKSNKIAENSSLTSSITSGSTNEITDEELILIGTAIKSCPNFGRESSIEYNGDQDEPCETLSYPALMQNETTSTTQTKASSSFRLQEVSSASEISSAADTFYQFSAENMEDVPCTEADAVNRKDLWALQDIVSDDVIVIDN